MLVHCTTSPTVLYSATPIGIAPFGLLRLACYFMDLIWMAGHYML